MTTRTMFVEGGAEADDEVVGGNDVSDTTIASTSSQSGNCHNDTGEQSAEDSDHDIDTWQAVDEQDMSSSHLKAVIILAGGTGERLGGVSKADIVIAGKRLVDYCLESFESTVLKIVVASKNVEVPHGVGRVQEDPPLSGPAAGVVAGWEYLQKHGNFDPDDLVGIMSVDAPLAGYALQQMAKQMSLANWGESSLDPVTSDHVPSQLIPADAPAPHPPLWNGQSPKIPVAARAVAKNVIQQCIAVLPIQALSTACAQNADNMSLRRFWKRVQCQDITVAAELVDDVDCPEDLVRVGKTLTKIPQSL